MIWGWFLKKAWPFVLMFCVAAYAVFTVRRNGKLQERIGNAEAKTESLQRMQDAVANTPTDVDSVVDRLRKHGF